MAEPTIFWVHALRPDGRTQRGFCVLPASEEGHARLLMEKNQTLVIRLQPLPVWLSVCGVALLSLLARPWPLKPLAEFLHSLGVMLGSGIPIDMAAQELAKEQEHPDLKAFAFELHDQVQAGNTVVECLERHARFVPPTVVALVSVGEKTGTLDQALRDAAAHVRRLERLRQDIGQALIYPAFALSTILLAMLFWIFYVLPHMAVMFRQMGAELPVYTRMAMDGLQWVTELQEVYVWAALAAVTLVLALLMRIPRVRLAISRTLLRLPISGHLIRVSQLALMAEHMALLVRAGLPMDAALDVLTDSTRHAVFKAHLARVRDGVSRGHSLSHEMERTGAFPSMMVRMLHVGEQSGTLDKQLKTLAEEYQRRLDHAISTLSEILKPLLLVIAGAVFVIVVVVFLLPVYQLISQIMN
jgi:type II secretory pathway component PulF